MTDRKRTIAIQVRVTEQEKRQMERQARQCGLSLSGYPISFEREIGSTVYTVNAHFSDRATENPEQKTFRILTEI